MDIQVARRSGQFGPNRMHEVGAGKHKFLVAIVGSGACRLVASVDRDGTLRLPHRGAEWVIELASTGGGKITEVLSGRHAEAIFEASTERHKGFQLARMIFGELWATWFAPDMPEFARSVVDALRQE